mmetsp:Transcript_83367/g.225959  ORF Transcript_83367/g.225959 Transcript_83367/m.225959 type:complete len:337 (+) Transcript_83367:165-1175(+)
MSADSSVPKRGTASTMLACPSWSHRIRQPMTAQYGKTRFRSELNFQLSDDIGGQSARWAPKTVRRKWEWPTTIAVPPPPLQAVPRVSRRRPRKASTRSPRSPSWSPVSGPHHSSSTPLVSSGRLPRASRDSRASARARSTGASGASPAPSQAASRTALRSSSRRSRMPAPTATPVESAPPRFFCSRASRITTTPLVAITSFRAKHVVSRARVRGEEKTASGRMKCLAHSALASTPLGASRAARMRWRSAVAMRSPSSVRPWSFSQSRPMRSPLAWARFHRLSACLIKNTSCSDGTSMRTSVSGAAEAHHGGGDMLHTRPQQAPARSPAARTAPTRT